MNNEPNSTDKFKMDDSEKAHLLDFPTDYTPNQSMKNKQVAFGLLIGCFLFVLYVFRAEFFAPKQELPSIEPQQVSLLDLNFVPFMNKEILPAGNFKFYTKNEKGKWDLEEKSLKGFVGKPIIIHLWATFCGPCVQELPFYDKFSKATEGTVQNIAIMPGKGDPKDIESFYNQKGIENLTVVVDDKNILVESFKIQGIPTSIFISSSGKPLGYITGAVAWEDSSVVKLLMNLLKKP